MRYLFGFLSVCALAMVPLVGCSETAGDGGSGGSAGSGGMGGDGGSGGVPECRVPEHCDDGEECTADTCADGMCENTPVGDGTTCDERNECTVGTCANGTCESTPVQDGTTCGDGAGTCQAGSCVGRFACSEQGIRDAIEVHGGPHTFACDGPTTVEVESPIGIGGGVILDGEGNLTVDGKLSHTVFHTGDSVELRNFVITRATNGGGINNAGTLLLTDSTVSGNREDGIINELNDYPDPDFPTVGVLTLANSTVSGNGSAGILNWGVATISNSTVSDNLGQNSNDPPFNGGIVSYGTVTVASSTFSGNGGGDVVGRADGSVTIRSSVVDGGCEVDADSVITSNGYNIESTGNTCGFDQTGDQSSVPDAMLGPLQNNGGLTETHALLVGSPAINRIPAVDCGVTTDQRGEPRPVGDGCDVGSFERQPEDP